MKPWLDSEDLTLPDERKTVPPEDSLPEEEGTAPEFLSTEEHLPVPEEFPIAEKEPRPAGSTPVRRLAMVAAALLLMSGIGLFGSSSSSSSSGGSSAAPPGSLVSDWPTAGSVSLSGDGGKYTVKDRALEASTLPSGILDRTTVYRTSVFVLGAGVDSADVAFAFAGEYLTPERVIEALEYAGYRVSFPTEESRMIFVGEERSADLVLVGDPDDPTNCYLARGSYIRNFEKQLTSTYEVTG